MLIPEHFKAPPTWDYRSGNPFTPGGSYGAEWSCFRIPVPSEPHSFNGRGANGLYVFCPGHSCGNLEERLADFLRYESAHGRRVIVAAPSDIDVDALVKRSLLNTPDGRVVRRTDPRWVVHSTPLESWRGIQKSGELWSLARLAKETASIAGIGARELGDPQDYAEYVTLGDVDSLGPEFVVASHQRGTVTTNETVPYGPGQRLYFDCHRIIRDGIACRDGLHTVKVRDRLPLKPYLAAAVGVKDVDPTGAVPTWTPRLFVPRANAHFREMIART